MKNFPLIAILSVFTLSPSVAAQDGKGKQDPQAVEASAPKPGVEHQNLKLAEGTWNAVLEMPGSAPTKGVSEMKMSLGGFWLVDNFRCDFDGMKFEGCGTTGYDPIKGRYVSTWIDNMNPAMTVTEGTFDAKTRTLTMTGDGYDHRGAKVKVRTALIHKDADMVVFEMHQTGADGKEDKVLTITYTRAVPVPAKPAK